MATGRESNPLNSRQQNFVREFLLDLNGTQAAIRAGYSAKGADVQAIRLLGNARIQAAIAEQRQQHGRTLEITAERILQEFARIGFSDITHVAGVHGGTVIIADTGTLPPETTTAIAELSENSSGGLRVKMHNKITALENLAKHLGVGLTEAAANSETPAREDTGLTPAAFAADVLGVTLSDKQLEMLALIHGNQRTALAGAHASGKTYAAAIFALWWLWRYEDGIVLITATKMDQTARMWNEVRQFWNRCPRLRAGLGQDARLLDRKLDVGPMRYAERFTAAVSVAGGDAQATGAQGAHSPSGRVLVVVEEADGVATAVYNALEGSMSSDNAKMVMLFNPLRRGGPAYNAMRSPQWAQTHISGMDSPNFRHDDGTQMTVDDLVARIDANPEDPWFHDDPNPFLTGRAYMRDLWLRCGQHGERDWFGRGLGEYAPQGERAIFNAHLVEALTAPQTWNRQASEQNPNYQLRIGIDWAAGRGGDRLAIAVVQSAEDGYRLVGLESTNYVRDTLDWMIGILTPFVYHTKLIGLDSTGGGEEMFNRLRDFLRTYPMDRPPAMVRVNFGSAALDTDSYANKRAEMYFSLHYRMRQGRFHADLPEVRAAADDSAGVRRGQPGPFPGRAERPAAGAGPGVAGRTGRDLPGVRAPGPVAASDGAGGAVGSPLTTVSHGCIIRVSGRGRDQGWHS